MVLQSLQGLQTRTPTGASMDFSATIGLGTYDDIAPWIHVHSIRLYPLGDWGRDTIYLDEHNRLYLTDFEQIARIGETITDGLDALIFDHSSEAFVVIPPRLF